MMGGGDDDENDDQRNERSGETDQDVPLLRRHDGSG